MGGPHREPEGPLPHAKGNRARDVSRDSGDDFAAGSRFAVVARGLRGAVVGVPIVVTTCARRLLDGLSFRDVSILGELDVALGRLEPTNLLAGPYPTFKNPDIGFRPGRSLCRFGFPFEQIAVSFDPARSAFSLDQLQLALFPIEGILTRIIAGTGTPAQFIETSSPGLRGQSGGPLCDSRGRIWGIQSRTAHLPLGFNPTVTANGRTFEEHQFINLGWAVHVRLILEALRARGVQVDVSAD